MKVMIVGAGKLGYKLAESMINTEVDVTIIEKDTDKLERINDHLDVLIVAVKKVLFVLMTSWILMLIRIDHKE